MFLFFSFRIKLSKAVGFTRPFATKTITALLDYYRPQMNNIDKGGVGKGS